MNTPTGYEVPVRSCQVQELADALVPGVLRHVPLHGYIGVGLGLGGHPTPRRRSASRASS